MDALPAELIDLVVENIDADDDMHDLKSLGCSTTTKALSPLLVICGETSLGISKIIHILSNTSSRYGSSFHPFQLPEEYPHSLAVGSVLGKLHNVRELKIVGLAIGSSWSRLPLQFTDALFKWLRACDGTLDHICCKFMNNLPPAAFGHMLAASSSLEFIRCRDVSDSDSEAREVSSEFRILPATRPLRRLRFDQSESVVRFFLQADSQNYVLKGLKKLDLSSFSLPSPSSQLCCAVADSLEDLTLHLVYPGRDLGLPQHFPHLRRLTLELMGNNASAHHKEHLHHIIRVCFSPKIAPALSHVVVDMSIFDRLGDAKSTLWYSTFEDGLDDYFATHPTVKKLSVVLSFLTNDHLEDPIWRAEKVHLLRVAFPRMAAKGRLDVELKHN
ncbi:hypothetical protein HMN09_00872400 [Mycena chlorophos]|uniref:Uncharacterized protein n=1 Tax=Mycena chlorophos TaxID=658473 RepID=A0A8H6W2B9_MYCCL|nr:hypothetical protein HMN09_00872400 [Mycena chlorophos]